MKMSTHFKKFSFSLSALACFLTTVSTVHGFDSLDFSQPTVPNVPQPIVPGRGEDRDLAPYLDDDGIDFEALEDVSNKDSSTEDSSEEDSGGWDKNSLERPSDLKSLAEFIVENVENSSDVYKQINGVFKYHGLKSFRETYSRIKKVSPDHGSYFNTRFFCVCLKEENLLTEEILEKITDFFKCKVEIQKSRLNFLRSYTPFKGFESLELAKALGLKKDIYKAAYDSIQSIKAFGELQGDDDASEQNVKELLIEIFNNINRNDKTNTNGENPKKNLKELLKKITEKLDVYEHCYGMVKRVLEFVKKIEDPGSLHSLHHFADFYILDKEFVRNLSSFDPEGRNFQALNDSLDRYQRENGLEESLTLTAQSINGGVLRNLIFPLIEQEHLNAEEFASFFQDLLLFIQRQEFFLKDKTPYEKEKYLNPLKDSPFYGIAQKDFLSIYGKFLSKIREDQFKKFVYGEYLKRL